MALLARSTSDHDLQPGERPGWAVRVTDLALELPVDRASNTWRPVLRGLTVQVTDEALRQGLAHATTVVDRLSRTRVDEFLEQLAASPWLRSFRWYYASLLRLAAVENGLDLDGELVAGRVVTSARFRPAVERGFLGQIRDLAKGAVTITARITPTVGDRGRLRLRITLEPDVRGLVAKLVIGALSRRPGVYRVDDDAVEIDVGLMVAQEANVPVEWEAVVQMVEIAPGVLTLGFGPREGDAD